jgi:alanine dehydrogenase
MGERAALDPLWITEQDVVETVDLSVALRLVRDFLLMEADGDARTMQKAQLSWDGGHTLHAVGAVAERTSLAGTKTWAHTAGGATPLMLLWDSETGRLLAIIEAFALGQLRTASIAGLATDMMASPDADEFALIGTGKQALPQLAAVAAVRPLQVARVYSPTPEHREQFAKQVADAGIAVRLELVASVGDAVRNAAVITTATRAREPFLSSADVAIGAHINAVGAIAPDRRELHEDVVENAELIAADDPLTVHQVSDELSSIAAERVVALSRVVAGKVPRPANAKLTLYKGVGMGLADLAVAATVLERVRATDRGRALPHPRKLQPTLTGAAR